MTPEFHADDWFPVDARAHEAQLAALLRRLGTAPRRVLDLGAGSGRIAAPLARAGHHVVAVDSDDRALSALREAGVATIRADFAAPGFAPSGAPFDAALCLGHTLMTLADMDRAVTAATNARCALAPGGFLALDDLCEVWREVADGHWQSGVSDDGRWQIVWEPDDAVIALRRDESVNEKDWQVREHDRRFRLWSRGALSLLARAAGFAEPEHHAAERLIVLTRPSDEAANPTD